MTRQKTYQQCAVGGASPIGLIITLFDRLISDFGRAAQAIHKDDIESRCRELNHALLVLGQLETWVDLKNGGEPARHLSAFYAHLRASMLQASITQSATILEQCIQTILEIRSKWQLLDAPEASPSPSTHVVSVPDCSLSQRMPLSQSA
jgi:flagellar protein FliS